jgi:RHS repeat-associated protein
MFADTRGWRKGGKEKSENADYRSSASPTPNCTGQTCAHPLPSSSVPICGLSVVQQLPDLWSCHTTAYDYDAAGNVSSIRDRRGKTTWQGYDDLNRLTTVRYQLLNTVSYGYDEDNNKTSVTDGNNHTTTFVYDLYKKLRSATTSEGETSTTDYDRFGNVTRTKNALNKTRLYEYDRLNRLTKEKDERNGEYTFEYDNMGNITESHDPNLTTATYSYTDNYQISTLHLQNGSKTKNVSYFYDEEGAVKQVTDDNVTTSYNNADATYLPDAYNRIKSEKTNINGKTFAVGYDYDVMDRITGITYPNNKLVTYSYNILGEITGMSDKLPDDATANSYLAQAPVYDNAGFLQSIKAANGVTAAFLYDENGRLENLSYANAANVIKGYKFTYDWADNITIIEKTENTQPALPNTYTYDKDNRLTNAYLKGSFTVNVDTESQTAMTAEDDLFGTEQLETAVSNVKLDFAAGSVGVNLGSEYQVTRIELTPQNQEIINNRVKAEDIRVFASVTSDQTYTEVPTDQFTAKYVMKNEVWIIEIVMKTPVRGRYIKIKTDWDDRNDDFTWADKTEFGNNVDKLIKVYYNAETRDEGYEYDALGNRTVEKVTLKGKAQEVKNYGYYADGSRLRSNGKWAYVYDANGNVVKKGDMLDIGGVITKVKDATTYLNTITDSVNNIQFSTADKGTYWQYEYDLMNRMIKVSKNNEEIAAYTYSWKGYRVKKVKLNATANELKTTYYIFSPNGKLLYQEEEKYGLETTNFYRQYDYLFNKLFAKDVGRVGTTTADARFYYHTDHLGSVTAITDEAGNTAWGNEFTPFGSAADGGNKPDGGFKFASYTYDEDVQLNYALARWQDPETGRFTSLDPAKDGVNWYAYCRNNPINNMDPTGLDSYGDHWSDMQGAENQTDSWSRNTAGCGDLNTFTIQLGAVAREKQTFYNSWANHEQREMDQYLHDYLYNPDINTGDNGNGSNDSDNGLLSDQQAGTSIEDRYLSPIVEKTGLRFSSYSEAYYYFCQFVKSHYKGANPTEFGGIIYFRNIGGQIFYGYTIAQGDATSVNYKPDFSNMFNEEKGDTIIAQIHSHPGGDYAIAATLQNEIDVLPGSPTFKYVGISMQTESRTMGFKYEVEWRDNNGGSHYKTVWMAVSPELDASGNWDTQKMKGDPGGDMIVQNEMVNRFALYSIIFFVISPDTDDKIRYFWQPPERSIRQVDTSKYFDIRR